MSTDLVRRDNLTGLAIGEMQTVAQLLSQSGFFNDKKTPAQAFVAVLAGQELGLPPFAAIKGIHIIQGKPEVAADTLAAMVKRSGRYDYRIAKLDDSGCTLRFFEHGDHVGDSTFTIEDAKKAGLLSNKTWQQYPRNMCFSRSMSNGVGWFCPDVTHGRVYVDGEIPDSTPRPQAQQTSPQSEPVAVAPTSPVTADEVVLDVEAVPSTPDPSPVAPPPDNEPQGDAGTAPAESDDVVTSRAIAMVRDQFAELSDDERITLKTLMDANGIQVSWASLVEAMNARGVISLDGLMRHFEQAEDFQASVDTNTTDGSLQGAIDTQGLQAMAEAIGSTLDDVTPKGRRKLTPKAPA